jgi:hypothetical protein
LIYNNKTNNNPRQINQLLLKYPLFNANDAINKLLTPLKHWVKTLTFDNSIQAISEPARIINALESGVESTKDISANSGRLPRVSNKFGA